MVRFCPLTCESLHQNPSSFYQDYPDHLVEMQSQHWDPIFAWISKTYGVKVEKSNSILFDGQPAETRQKLLEALSHFDHWEMAGA